ncbi:YlbD family protein [Pseudoneobacillus sp. C159]
MTEKKLHPTVIKFKEFVKKHPKISNEVTSGKFTWQQLYEEWYLLGEEDPRWEPFREGLKSPKNENKTDNEKSPELMTKIFDYIKTMDMNQIQQHIYQASQALGAIQGILSQFQSSPPPQTPKPSSGPANPFSFRKD